MQPVLSHIPPTPGTCLSFLEPLPCPRMQTDGKLGRGTCLFTARGSPRPWSQLEAVRSQLEAVQSQLEAVQSQLEAVHSSRQYGTPAMPPAEEVLGLTQWQLLPSQPCCEHALQESPRVVVETWQGLTAAWSKSTKSSKINYRELPTLLSHHRADMQVRSKVELHDDIKITPRIKLEHEGIVGKGEETHSDTYKGSATVKIELIKEAMTAGFDNKGLLQSSQATARLLLLDLSRRCCAGTAGSRELFFNAAVEIGVSAIERLFFSSLPKELVEIVNVQYVAQAYATNNFLQLLASEGSFDIDVMFCSHGIPLSESTSLAGSAHQLASADQNDENGNQRMFLVLCKKDLHGAFSEDKALSTCLITYRGSDHSKSLDHISQRKQFSDALDLAAEFSTRHS